MTTTTPQLRRAGADQRFAQLSERVRSVRRRAGFGRPDVWMLVVGGTLMPLGALLILLGWAGASKTPLAFEQTSYLISGGILGLALVIAGGFVYFGYWQTLRVRESRQQAQDLAAGLARLEQLLAGSAGVADAAGSAGVDPRTARTRANGAAPSRFAYVATPSGSIFHRPDCTVVAGRTDVSGVDPATTKLDACRICNPLQGSAGDNGAVGSPSGAS